MNNPANEFSITTLSCFDVPLDTVLKGIELVLTQHGMKVSTQPGPLDYTQFGPEPLRGPGLAKAGLWSPTRRGQNASVMISNLADGWLTLATAVSARLGCSCWRFTVSGAAEQLPRNAFALLSSGERLRSVSAQLEDREWVFFQKGSLLDIEDASQYKRRLIKDRVNSEYVVSIAKKAGFDMASDEFWRTDGSSVLLTEVR